MKTIKNGYSFSSPVRITGFIMIFIAILMFIDIIPGIDLLTIRVKGDIIDGWNKVAVGLLPLAIGLFLSFTAYGVQLDPNNDRFREYGGYFFIKTGSWQRLSDHPDMSILQKNETYKGRVMGVASTGQYTFKSQEICLFSPDHRERVPIFKSMKDEKVQNMAEELSQYLGRELVTYSPKRSKRTKRRTR